MNQKDVAATVGGRGGDVWGTSRRRRVEVDLTQLWQRNLGVAQQANARLHPIQFAKMVADTNFLPLIAKRPDR